MHKWLINLPGLLPNYRIGWSLPGENELLTSVESIFNASRNMTYSEWKVNNSFKNKIILIGTSNKASCMWLFRLQQSRPAKEAVDSNNNHIRRNSLCNNNISISVRIWYPIGSIAVAVLETTSIEKHLVQFLNEYYFYFCPTLHSKYLRISCSKWKVHMISRTHRWFSTTSLSQWDTNIVNIINKTSVLLLYHSQYELVCA